MQSKQTPTENKKKLSINFVLVTVCAFDRATSARKGEHRDKSEKRNLIGVVADFFSFSYQNQLWSFKSKIKKGKHQSWHSTGA